MCYQAGISCINGHELEIRIRRLAALVTAVNQAEMTVARQQAVVDGGEEARRTKKQCLCSPTLHPGSFRCRHHHSEYVLAHPPWTNLAEEPLGFRGIGFSPIFALLKPIFSLPLRPLPLARVLHSKAERSPTDVFLHPTASADRLGPFIFGARALD
ncbi:hypothetical protein R6Q59_033850 [Mikania micrantha]